MTATETTAQADPKTDESKTDAPDPPKVKASKPKKTPTSDAISKAMQTLADAGIMSEEDQMEAAVTYKLTGIFGKITTILATVGFTIPEGQGIALFIDGGFGLVDDDDDDDDAPKGKKGKKAKKGKKGKKAKADDDTDWRADAAVIRKALIAYEKDDDDVSAKTIHTKMGQRGATAPAITTIYNWLKKTSLPNQKYHRKLRSILGLNV